VPSGPGAAEALAAIAQARSSESTSTIQKPAFRPERFAQYGIAERAESAYQENPPVTHPVVRTNVATGRKGLFVNQNFTSHIAGVSERESKASWPCSSITSRSPNFKFAGAGSRVRWRSVTTVSLSTTRSPITSRITGECAARRFLVTGRSNFPRLMRR
jgi:hypothetical protein